MEGSGEEKKGEVWTELSHLDDAITALSADLDVLGKRIGPLLSQEKVDNSKLSPGTPDTTLCALAGKIRVIMRRVVSCTTEINKLKSGLEV